MKEKDESGLSTERLNKLAGAIRQDVEARRYDGGVVMVARHGVVGLQEAIGFADRAANRPSRLDDVFHMMSVTKAFTDVLLLSRIERGDLLLTTRVTEIIPEFKGGFKEQVTIFHLLTHTAGAPPVAYPADPSIVGKHEAMFQASYKLGLVSPPGEKVNYSAIWGHVILGEVLRRIDRGKRALRDIFQADLFGPLKMKDTALGKRRDLVSRVVPVVLCGEHNLLTPEAVEIRNKVMDENSEQTAGGAVSTVHDLFRFAEMLRRGGELDGVRILSPVTIALATTVHTGTKINESLYPMFAEHGWAPFPANVGLDLIIRGEGTGYPSSMGNLTSPRTFGKFGAGSTGFWVDPERDVTFIFLSVGLLDEYSNFLRFQRLSDMAISAVI